MARSPTFYAPERHHSIQSTISLLPEHSTLSKSMTTLYIFAQGDKYDEPLRAYDTVIIARKKMEKAYLG